MSRSTLVSFAARSALALALVSLGACAPKNNGNGNTSTTTADPDSQSLADDGTDTSSAEGDPVSLAGTLVASSGTTLGLASESGGDLHLDNIVGGGSRLLFMPAGCLTVTNPTASSVKYVFNACGRLGLRGISGELDVSYVYTAAANKLSLTITSQSLVINGATLDWNVTADITASGAMRTMVWSGHFTGTTKGGRQIDRQNDKTVTWTVGGSCIAVEGTSEGNVTGKDLKTELINYKQCKDSCPEPDSQIKITNETTGKSVDLTYGTDEATFTDARGDSINYVPLCASL